MLTFKEFIVPTKEKCLATLAFGVAYMLMGVMAVLLIIPLSRAVPDVDFTYMPAVHVTTFLIAFFFMSLLTLKLRKQPLRYQLVPAALLLTLVVWFVLSGTQILFSFISASLAVWLSTQMFLYMAISVLRIVLGLYIGVAAGFALITPNKK